LAPGELRIHPAAHQGGTVLRYHGLCPVHLPPRFRERPIFLRRGAGLFPDRHRRRRGAPRLALLRHEAAPAASAHRGPLNMTAQAALTEQGGRPAPEPDWAGLAARARIKRRAKSTALYAFL